MTLLAAQSVTVADYSWQFFERVLQRKYGDTEEQNAEKASQNFYSAHCCSIRYFVCWSIVC